MLPAILALAFGGLLLLGVAIDLTRWSGSHREAAFAADAGAQAGAAIVSEEGLRSGGLAVDEAAAREVAIAAALRSRPRPGRSGCCLSGNGPAGMAGLRLASRPTDRGAGKRPLDNTYGCRYSC